MYSEPDPSLYRRAPKVPLDRRAYAFLLDFVTVWLLSSFFQGFARAFVFIAAWGVMRVVVVEKNKGQSLGRWAFDIRLIDLRYNSTPRLVDLAKREGILGFAALLAMEGLNINFQNGLSMILLILPLIVDCSTALSDDELNQAFHDRVAQTQVVQTRRGYSLDLRLKKWWVEIRKSFPSQDRR
jgi:uncharacterized RDD family membrane protein YckC